MGEMVSMADVFVLCRAWRLGVPDPTQKLVFLFDYTLARIGLDSFLLKGFGRILGKLWAYEVMAVSTPVMTFVHPGLRGFTPCFELLAPPCVGK